MARRSKNSGNGIVVLVLLIMGAVSIVIEAVFNVIKVIMDFVSNNIREITIIGIVVGVIIISVLLVRIFIWARNSSINKQREKLLQEILELLTLEDIDAQFNQYDDCLSVKSRQTLNDFSDLKYFREINNFESVRMISESKKIICNKIYCFLKENSYKTHKQYGYVEEQLINYVKKVDCYSVKVVYITPAGNCKGERVIHIPISRIDEIIAHPEILMTKGEYNQYIKQQAKQELDNRKHWYYERINEIITFSNKSRKMLVVNSQMKKFEEMVDCLDRIVNNIQRINTIESYEWNEIKKLFFSTVKEIQRIVNVNKKIREYYDSEEFRKIKQTCELLSQSQQEFNEYIDEKTKAITKMFGTRVVRNQTQNEDIYNYNRVYKKNICPFTAEVSSSVFGSAENNPMEYVVKYFYPNKSQYKVQIEKLQILIEELETLKEAKDIIDNYKKDYSQYILTVPEYVFDFDEDGFYHRLGLAVIDEAIFNIEYKFTYTSDGGMAQRSFTIPMNEENIGELINVLESKLSQETIAKEQRALMTAKLRTQIKERDNYTCCQCGNSVHVEPNLLLEIDHIKPISKGGLTREDNLQTLCWKCNRIKGAKMI